MLPSQCDVVVIGGGPAGSSAAAFLGRAGFDVVLLEKRRHPRNVVGESLIPQFWRYARDLDAARVIQDEGFVVKGGAVHIWNGVARKLAFRPFGYDDLPLHVERDVFDHILLNNSRRHGARLFEDASVSKTMLAADHCRVLGTFSGEDFSIRARYVIDASGQTSVVSRQEGLRAFQDDFRFAAMWAYFKGGYFATYDGERYPVAAAGERLPVTFVSSIGDPGYSWLWHIVLRDTTSVGLILSLDYLKKLKQRRVRPREEFMRLARQTPVFGDLMEGSTYIEGSFSAVKDYAYTASRFVIGNCYLAGDAAAFVDPINAVGVTFSMYTGYLAGWCIKRSLERGDDEISAYYEQQLKSRISIYKTLALTPDHTPLANDEVALFQSAMRQESALEQELVLVQSRLTARPKRIRAIFAAAGLRTETEKIHAWHKEW